MTDDSLTGRVSSPFFTVIMPVYNHADYLAEAIASVRQQAFEDWELIIVDDGSKDASGRIADDLAAGDLRIRVIHQANAGPAAARNAALAVARGQWLTYIDSDDIWLPSALQDYREYIDAHPPTRFIHGYRHRMDEGGPVIEMQGVYQDRPTGPTELFDRMYLSHLCVCYRRELMDEVGGYDAGLRSCEDYELYLRMGLRCTFDPLGKVTGLRRRHGSNISRQTGWSRIQEARILQRFVERQGGSAVISPQQFHRRLGKLYYAAGRQYFKAGFFANAVEALGEARRHRRRLKDIALRVLALFLLPLGRREDRPWPV